MPKSANITRRSIQNACNIKTLLVVSRSSKILFIHDATGSIKFYEFLSCCSSFFGSAGIFTRERERAACWNNEKRKSEKGGKGIRREDWWEGEGGVENLGRRIALVPYGGETGCNGLRIATIEEFSLPFKRTR